MHIMKLSRRWRSSGTKSTLRFPLPQHPGTLWVYIFVLELM
jgi:hypothetical protein